MDAFKLKDKDTIRVKEAPLRETAVVIFEKMGMPIADAHLGADVLITADLRGVASHGVSNILQRYVGFFKDGLINPKPQWRVLRESAAVTSIDCDGGLGIVIAPKAMGIAIEKARHAGTGSSNRPTAWSIRRNSTGPKRDKNSSRGSASNWPMRARPNSCSSRTVSGGSRRASMGKRSRKIADCRLQIAD